MTTIEYLKATISLQVDDRSLDLEYSHCDGSQNSGAAAISSNLRCNTVPSSTVYNATNNTDSGYDELADSDYQDITTSDNYETVNDNNELATRATEQQDSHSLTTRSSADFCIQLSVGRIYNTQLNFMLVAITTVKVVHMLLYKILINTAHYV